MVLAALAATAAVSAGSVTIVSAVVNDDDIGLYTQDTDSDPFGLALLSDGSLVFYENEQDSPVGSETFIRVDFSTELVAASFTEVANESQMLTAMGGGVTDIVTPRDITADDDDNLFIAASFGGANQAIFRIPDTDGGAGITFGTPEVVVGPGAPPTGSTGTTTAVDVDNASDMLYILIDSGTADDTTTNGVYRIAKTATAGSMTLVASYQDLYDGWLPPGITLGTSLFGGSDIHVLPDGSVTVGMSFTDDSPDDGAILRIADPLTTPTVSVLISHDDFQNNVGNNFGTVGHLLMESRNNDLFICQHGSSATTTVEGIARFDYTAGVATFVEMWATKEQMADTAEANEGGQGEFTIDSRAFAMAPNGDIFTSIGGLVDFESHIRIRDHTGELSSIGAASLLLIDDDLAAYNTGDLDFDSDPSGCAVLSDGSVAFFESEANDDLIESGTEDSILLYRQGVVTVIAGEAAIRGADPNSSGSGDESADMRIQDICADAADNLYAILFEEDTINPGVYGEEYIIRLTNTGPGTFSAPERIVAVNDGPSGSDGAVACDVDPLTGRLYVLRDAGNIEQDGEVPVNAADDTNTGLFYLDNPGTVASGDNGLTQAVGGTAIGSAVTPAVAANLLGLDDLVVRRVGGGTDVIVSVPATNYDAILGGLDGDLVQCDPGAGTASLFIEASAWTAVLGAVTPSTRIGEGVTLEAGDLVNDDGDEEILVLASSVEGVIAGDRAEDREGLIRVSSDGSTATLIADQLDFYLRFPRLAGFGDLGAFSNALSFDDDSDRLYIFFANNVESLVALSLGPITAADGWELYR
jgi:hypothetical protein